MLDIKRVFIFIVMLSGVSVFFACHHFNRNKTHPEISYASILKGKELAAVYCQSCHALPEPSLLDSKSWEKGVLPAMGPRLGIFFYNNTVYPSQRYDHHLDKNFYPSAPIISYDQWKNIIDYYVAVAPDTLLPDQNKQPPIVDNLPGFHLIKPSGNFAGPATAMVKINDTGMFPGFVISDAVRHMLFKFDDNAHLVDSIDTENPVVDLQLNESGKWIGCNIGILNPNNGKFGSANSFFVNNSGKLQKAAQPLFNGLQRPVEILPADLNNDGKLDYVVCEFGALSGALSWMENLGDDHFTRHVIRPFPGALKVYVNDYNKDGLPDLWVLFAQGEEGIFLFTNKGNGEFEQREVLRFPPAYGSSYFELADFNKDGYPDVVYTCGDNADYSPILKPYHGVYIFINDGHYHFAKRYFFHINGCYKAIARDFDNDGNLDLATISFFADFSHHPNEGFIYFENKGDLKFAPHTLPLLQQGRWMTMDAGDINKDGKIDLILGNFSIGPTIMKHSFDWKKGPPFIVLQNVFRTH